MNQSLQNPTKPEDLDGYVQVRNELKLGLDEYQEQLANAQRRMTQLQQEHEIQKQTELARREEDLKAARDAERKRRKDYQHTARTLEAILRSHGVTVDLDGDGLIGLPKGQEPAILGEQDQATLKQLLDESKAAVGGTSRAFEKARALNPEPSPEVQEELPFDKPEPIASGTTTAEFEEEVAEVEEPKSPMVPKSRLDEVLAKNKEMQKRLQDIEGEKTDAPEVPEYDFVAKDKEYQELILDGETEKAAALRNEIRQAERTQLMSEMQSQMGQTVQQDREQHELAKKASEIMEVFPIFDEKSKSFDEKLTQEVMELRDAFIYQGYGAADSLAKATEVTLLTKKPELLQASDEPKADPAPTLTKAVQEKKQKATVQKKVEASQAQPPEMKGDSSKNKKVVDINTLSDDEFGALPEETLRRMRGDFD